jgi:3-dehydroquinate synthase
MQHTFKSKNYSVEIGSILNSSFEQFVCCNFPDARIVVIVDENVQMHCLEFLITSFDFLKEAEVILLPEGEENKVLEVCFQVWEALSEYGISRSDLIINLGGGVVTDMGGFIASVYKRGVNFIHIPTTLVGMIDASVGGKTGVDLGNYKNHLGVFSHPSMIYVDPIFLNTLPDSALMSGYAEMLKHALIADASQWEQLKTVEDVRELINTALLIESIRVKFEIVEKDPKDENIRKKLNAGHTIGHAIEGYFLDKNPLDHGHAVALGLLAESFISLQQELLNLSDFEALQKVITRNFQLVHLDESAVKAVVHLAQNDKKNKNNQINCSLLTQIGKCNIDCMVSAEEIKDALEFLNKTGANLN